MPANKFNGFSSFGIGIGLRIAHYEHILKEKPQIDFFEIISENFMLGGGRPLEILDEVLERYPIIQHGVSLYLGSLDPLDRKQIDALKRLADRTKTPFVSDHLCWGSFDGSYSHDLLPLPYTKEAVVNTANRIRFVQDSLELPIAVENVSSYLEYTDSEMTEWEFLSEVCELADCGILLDVNNVFVSSRNHSFDPIKYIENIPLDRVAQIHIAGHSEQDGYLLDTHDNFVREEVWDIYRSVIEKTGPTSTLLEWDAHIPDFEIVHQEALKAAQYANFEGISA
ncbi:DUF692 domain-containing protein [Candidatus Obscuribacterales bacterium]|nr:DUF692 domain-containing protein [Candidatus Obscuribacterales bacterium]